MIARRYALLIPAAVLVACAGGSTMRVVDDDNAENGPVALAPAPEAGPDSTATPAPVAAAPQSTSTETEASAAPAPATADSAQGYAPYGNSRDLAIRRIGQWTHTGISEARRLIIRDANAWAAFWSELGVGDRPSVDFSRDLVIAVAAGQRPSGGHEIAVSQVTEDKGELQVEVVETSPGPNCMTTSSLTQPVDVVVVPGVTTRSWSFTEHKEVRGCR
jgi:hypothetical protein